MIGTNLSATEPAAAPPALASLKPTEAPFTPGASMQLVTLHLARCPGFPSGSAGHGYAFVAPLDEGGHLDAETWRQQRERCHVRRFWGGERDRLGHLVHRRGGAGGATWCFSYRDARGNDDEAGHHLQDHRFALGDYVSIREEDGEVKTFQVADVTKACAR